MRRDRSTERRRRHDHVADTRFRQGAATALGENHAITLFRESPTHTGADLASLCVRLEHNSFALLGESQAGEEGAVDIRHGITVGELTGPPPARCATRLGIVAETPATGNGRGERLVGDAAMTGDISTGGYGSGPSLHVALGGIRNIDCGTASRQWSSSPPRSARTGPSRSAVAEREFRTPSMVPATRLPPKGPSADRSRAACRTWPCEAGVECLSRRRCRGPCRTGGTPTAGRPRIQPRPVSRPPSRHLTSRPATAGSRAQGRSAD